MALHIKLQSSKHKGYKKLGIGFTVYLIFFELVHLIMDLLCPSVCKASSFKDPTDLSASWY